MDSTMPASVALNMPSTAAEVTVGRPHWPARGGTAGCQGGGHPGTWHPGASLGPTGAPQHQQCYAESPHPSGKVVEGDNTQASWGCQALTGVGDPKPGCHGQDLPPGVRPGLVAVRLGLAGEDAGACQHVAEQPHHHDGQDDLQGQRPGCIPHYFQIQAWKKGWGGFFWEGDPPGPIGSQPVPTGNILKIWTRSRTKPRPRR